MIRFPCWFHIQPVISIQQSADCSLGRVWVALFPFRSDVDKVSGVTTVMVWLKNKLQRLGNEVQDGECFQWAGLGWLWLAFNVKPSQALSNKSYWIIGLTSHQSCPDTSRIPHTRLSWEGSHIWEKPKAFRGKTIISFTRNVCETSLCHERG